MRAERTTRGMTIVEVSLYCVLLGILLDMAVQLFMAAYTNGGMTGRINILRDTATAATLVTRELNNCVAVYSPDMSYFSSGASPNKLTNYRSYDMSNPFVFHCRQNPTTDVVVGYQLQNQTLARMLYSPAFDPSTDLNTAPAAPVTPLVTNVTSCSFFYGGGRQYTMTINVTYYTLTFSQSFGSYVVSFGPGDD